MSKVEHSVDVDVPVSTAYNQWTQFASFPWFMSGVDSITQIDDTTNHWVTSIGGVRREFDTRIVEQIPDERIAWTAAGGDVQHAGVVTFHRLTERATRIMIQLEWQPSGVAEHAGAAVGLDEHQVKADANRFKEFIENRALETGGWRGNVLRSTN